jgi:hypothetical protein
MTLCSTLQEIGFPLILGEPAEVIDCCTAVQKIIACFAIKVVVVGSTIQGVVACAAKEVIVSLQAIEIIVSLAAVKDVVVGSNSGRLRNDVFVRPDSTIHELYLLDSV